MQYDAITLDSNVFIHNGLNLESGLLAQLAQFAEGSAQFVLSEIVIRELHKHLALKATEAREDLAKAIKGSVRTGLFGNDEAERIEATHGPIPSGKEVASKRLQKFIDSTGAEIIRADTTDMKELIRRYFAPAAPFESTGKKKHEFPDGIALLSLEQWGRTHEKKILAISSDAGWAEFAKTSEWINVEEDLPNALQRFQEHAEQSRVTIAALLTDLEGGKLPELLQAITSLIEKAVVEMEVSAEADSAFHYEAEPVEMVFQDFDFQGSGGAYELKIVQIGRDKIVAYVGVDIDASAECSFSLSAWDSIDKDYISMGSTSVQKDVEFEANALITLQGDFSGDPADIEVTALELVDTIDSVDFGEIELDYGEDQDDPDEPDDVEEAVE